MKRMIKNSIVIASLIITIIGITAMIIHSILLYLIYYGVNIKVDMIIYIMPYLIIPIIAGIGVSVYSVYIIATFIVDYFKSPVKEKGMLRNAGANGSNVRKIYIKGTKTELIDNTEAVGKSALAEKYKQLQDQLKIAVDNQKVDSLKIVLEIETQMNSRKLEFDKASKQVREADLAKEADEKIDILSDYFHTTKESYFNALDRLCYCIEKGYISDKDWRTEYRNLIHDVIVNYENDFGEASPYNNIKNLNKKWQQS